MSANKSYEASIEHFNRFRRSIVRLEDALGSFLKEEITDHAYTAAMLGHHMFDWIKHDRGDPNHDYRNMMTKRHECLGILHDVCNAVKHVTVSAPMSDVGATAVHTSVGLSSAATELLGKMAEDPHTTHQVQGRVFL
jgi:hypothetical protein